MAENKTKPTNISVPAFLDACADEARRTDAKALAKLMQKVTGNEPAMWGASIVGFDSYHCIYGRGAKAICSSSALRRERPQRFVRHDRL